MAFGRARKTTEAYRALLEVPMDLASAGFAVTITQTDTGWTIDLHRQITDGCDLHLEGSARSFAAALFQIAQTYDVAIDDLKREARRRGRDEPAA